MLRRRWPYYISCVLVPHIMLVVGIIFLSRQNPEIKNFGKNLCKWSTAVLIFGSLIYYIFFTPLFGLD